jgi:hypothetical protein
LELNIDASLKNNYALTGGQIRDREGKVLANLINMLDKYGRYREHLKCPVGVAKFI